MTESETVTELRAAQKHLADGRVETKHLSVPSIIETYADRLLDLHHGDADRASIIEERDDLLAWYTVHEAAIRGTWDDQTPLVTVLTDAVQYAVNDMGLTDIDQARLTGLILAHFPMLVVAWEGRGALDVEREVIVRRAQAEAVVTLMGFVADEKPIGPTGRNLARKMRDEYVAILAQRESAESSLEAAVDKAYSDPIDGYEAYLQLAPAESQP